MKFPCTTYGGKENIIANRKRTEVHKRNLALKDLLCKHRGIENAITTKSICSELNSLGHLTKKRSLPVIIQKLREEYNLPIGYKRQFGYFVVKSRKDIEVTVEDMEMQIKTLQETIEFMKSFIIE